MPRQLHLECYGDFIRRVALLSDGFLDRAGNVLDFGDRFRNLVDCNDGIVGRFLISVTWTRISSVALAV